MAFRKLEKDPNLVANDTSTRTFRRIESTENPEFRQSKIESVLSAGAKGLAQGAQELARWHDPVTSFLTKGRPEQQFKQVAEQALPSKEGFAESTAEHTGRILPSLALGGQGALRSIVGSLLGGTAGAAVEESGGGEVSQALAEIIGSGFAGLGRGKISPDKAQKKLVEFARKYGLSEAEIAPAIQSEKKISMLTPIAHKGPSTIEKVGKSRSGIGKIYQQLAESPSAQAEMAPQTTATFLRDLHEEIMKVPAQVRNRIEQDFVDLTKSGFTGKNLMNFYQDINSYMGKGMRELGGVKNAVGRQLENILGEDFKLTNELYKNVRKLGIRLRPDLAEDFNNMRQRGELAYGVVSGNASLIKTVLGEFAGTRLISNLLTNPRMQNLTKKIYEEVNHGRYASAQKALDLLLKENKEED